VETSSCWLSNPENWLGGGLLADIRNRWQRYSWTLQQVGDVHRYEHPELPSARKCPICWAGNVAFKQPGLKSSRLRCLGCPPGDGLSSSTIHLSRAAQECNYHGVGQTIPALHRSCHQWMAPPTGACRPRTRRTYWTLLVNWSVQYCVIDTV